MQYLQSTKRAINRLLARFDYKVTRISSLHDTNSGYSLYSYVRDDGSFDYESYQRIQTEGNKRKILEVWASEENIAFLSTYIKEHLGTPNFGICHGTRRGEEQRWFRQYLGCEVIGTEISDTARQFPNTIQWDFHETKPEWIGTTDFIYSNSFDHTYDPEKCLDAWMSCLRAGGICILEHSPSHGPFAVSQLDPFAADFIRMPYLLTVWGKGKYGVRELIEAPKKHRLGFRYQYFIVIMKF